MIAIVQPIIPHYRKDFFIGLKKSLDVDVYCYENENINKGNFKSAGLPVLNLKKIVFKNFIVFNIFPLLDRKYTTLVLMFTPYQLSTWILLLTKFIHKKKIIIWGHGISINKFQQEESNVSTLKKWLLGMADEAWFYTNYEYELWKTRMPDLKGLSLNNTISSVSQILNQPLLDKERLKEKYNINAPFVLIYCARFNEKGRRIDLLEETIQKTVNLDIEYIIIGEGILKPDFSKYVNVKDFGALYDQKIKTELFQIADVYFQPAWVGLSIVEAMAYGKPIVTFKRSEITPQCVEYSYIKDGFNGFLINSVEEIVDLLSSLLNKDLNLISKNAIGFVKENLTMEGMVDKAYVSLK